jgi:hypothetical protein
VKLTLWKFRMWVKSQDVADGYVHQNGKTLTFLGSAEDAKAMADNLQHRLAPNFPQDEVTVRPKACEQIGPHTVTKIVEMAEEHEEALLVARLLAWDLAQIQAQKELQLNPDIRAIAEQILLVAKEEVRRERQKLRAMQGQASALVGADGRPLARV